MSAPLLIPFAMLNAYCYCPRRFWYEFVQGETLVSDLMLEGTLQHARVDEPGTRLAPDGVTQVRRAYLASETLGIHGFADLIEERAGEPLPVEYKHGRSGRWLNDHVQLCAQALCLEEALGGGTAIPAGAIFAQGARQRTLVALTTELRAATRATILAARALAEGERVPPPLEGKLTARCRDCSLNPLCLPEFVTRLRAGTGATLADLVSD